MKRLILSALVLGAATQAAGCIIVSDDDPVGSASVNWQPLTVDFNTGNTLNAQCPAGSSAIVFSQPAGRPAGDALIDKFDCVDIAGVVTDLPTGDYEIYVRITDPAETGVYAESGHAMVAITDGGTAQIDAAMYIDQGFYALDWTLTGAGAPARCADVSGEDGVSIGATESGGSLFVDTIVDCEAGELGQLVLTDPMPLTDRGYTVSVALLNAAQESIGTADPVVGPAMQIGHIAHDIGTVNIVLQ